MRIREPAVAGLFYPSDEAALRQEVRRLLAAADDRQASVRPKALIVPHAGYVYSGPVAARAYQLLAPLRRVIRRVVLLGPAHRVPLRGMAVPSAETFATPLGRVPLDRDGVEALLGLADVIESDRAHAGEHCLEVQLPFLQCLLDDFRALPVLVGGCPPESVATAIDLAWGGDETLVVISSDLSHYLPYGQAVDVDRRTADRILARQARLGDEDACGAQAINGLLRSARGAALDLDLLDLRNSGDTAGDRSRVVGYGAFALH